MDRCPACRARLTEQPECPRCGCDFTLARRAEAGARRRLGEAIRTLAGGDRQRAKALLEQAQALKRSELGRVVGSLADATPGGDQPVPRRWKRLASARAAYPKRWITTRKGPPFSGRRGRLLP